jgi:hypothetical protein
MICTGWPVSAVAQPQVEDAGQVAQHLPRGLHLRRVAERRVGDVRERHHRHVLAALGQDLVVHVARQLERGLLHARLRLGLARKQQLVGLVGGDLPGRRLRLHLRGRRGEGRELREDVVVAA